MAELKRYYFSLGFQEEFYRADEVDARVAELERDLRHMTQERDAHSKAYDALLKKRDAWDKAQTEEIEGLKHCAGLNYERIAQLEKENVEAYAAMWAAQSRLKIVSLSYWEDWQKRHAEVLKKAKGEDHVK